MQAIEKRIVEKVEYFLRETATSEAGAVIDGRISDVNGH
jgi:hypothetical protein